MSQWLAGANHRDLTGLGHHNGPFTTFLGVVLHVNVSGKTSQGTSPDWYAAGGGPDEVCPNFQVMRDGTIWQLLPMNVQPWTQADGNFNYASIETGGDPDMPLTDAQLTSCALIVKAYHDQMGMLLQIANQPGQRGLGIHSMGGQAWGGHSCPGAIRAAQRTQILALANGTNQQEEDVPLDPKDPVIVALRNDIDDKFTQLFDRLTALFAVDTNGDGKRDVTGTVQGAALTALRTALNPDKLAAVIAAKIPGANTDVITAAVKAAIDGATIEVK